MSNSSSQSNVTSQMIELSHQLGREERKLAILGEGNTSGRLSKDTFVVKASGSNLASLTAAGVTECRFSGLLPLLTEKDLTDAQVDQALFDARVSADAKK